MILESHDWKPNPLRGDARQYHARVFDVPALPRGLRGRDFYNGGRTWELYLPAVVHRGLGGHVSDSSVGTFRSGGASGSVGSEGQWVWGMARSGEITLTALDVDLDSGTFDVDAETLTLYDYGILEQMIGTFFERYRTSR